jgi:hypothetical protein
MVYLSDLPPLTHLKIKNFYRTKLGTPKRDQSEDEPHNIKIFCYSPFSYSPNFSS